MMVMMLSKRYKKNNQFLKLDASKIGRVRPSIVKSLTSKLAEQSYQMRSTKKSLWMHISHILGFSIFHGG